MRCSGWSSLAISACSALALTFAGPAAAHVVTTPAFFPAGSSGTLNLTGPNERDEPMTGFSVTVPSEFLIVHAHPAPGWEASVEGATATWTGGSLTPGSEATFALELEAPSEPGPAALEASQLYPGGEIVRWPVALTVTPATETPSQNLGWAVVTALVGLLVITGIGVAMLRRARSLQEK